MLHEGAGGCTTETLKTHKTDLGEVVYPWHPFYGQAVKIKGERNRRGTIVYVCSSDGNDGGAVVEVPAWMFDSARPSCTFELDEKADRRCDRSASIYRYRRF